MLPRRCDRATCAISSPLSTSGGCTRSCYARRGFEWTLGSERGGAQPLLAKGECAARAGKGKRRMGSTSGRWSFGQASEWGRPPLDPGLRTAVTGRVHRAPPAPSFLSGRGSRASFGVPHIKAAPAHPLASAPVYPRLCRSRLHPARSLTRPPLFYFLYQNDVQEPFRCRRCRRPRRCQRPGRDLQRPPNLHLGHL